MCGCNSPAPAAPASGSSCGCTAAAPQPAKVAKAPVLIDCCGVAVPVASVIAPPSTCNYGGISACPSVPSFPAGVNEYSNASGENGVIVFNY